LLYSYIVVGIPIIYNNYTVDEIWLTDNFSITTDGTFDRVPVFPDGHN